MSDTVRSKNGIPIRLTSERWAHITDGHNEMAGMREDVLEVLAGLQGGVQPREQVDAVVDANADAEGDDGEGGGFEADAEEDHERVGEIADDGEGDDDAERGAE